MIEVQLNGQFPAGYRAAERINLSELMRTGTGRPPPKPWTPIGNARLLQADVTSEADFLAEHGFVLLKAPTRVTDWGDADQVASRYLPEVEAIIRERLFPGRPLIIHQPPNVMRRGSGTTMHPADGSQTPRLQVPLAAQRPSSGTCSQAPLTQRSRVHARRSSQSASPTQPLESSGVQRSAVPMVERRLVEAM